LPWPETAFDIESRPAGVLLAVWGRIRAAPAPTSLLAGSVPHRCLAHGRSSRAGPGRIRRARRRPASPETFRSRFPQLTAGEGVWAGDPRSGASLHGTSTPLPARPAAPAGASGGPGRAPPGGGEPSHLSHLSPSCLMNRLMGRDPLNVRRPAKRGLLDHFPPRHHQPSDHNPAGQKLAPDAGCASLSMIAVPATLYHLSCPGARN